jgi:hypothetical protein
MELVGDTNLEERFSSLSKCKRESKYRSVCPYVVAVEEIVPCFDLSFRHAVRGSDRTARSA